MPHWHLRVGRDDPMPRANLTNVFIIAGNDVRFARLRDRLIELGVFPVAEHIQHVPCCIPGCKTLSAGEQSLSLTHSSLWKRAADTPGSRFAIFEDDAETHTKPGYVAEQMLRRYHGQLLLYGHCEGYKCLHAYGVDAVAGAKLWHKWNEWTWGPDYATTTVREKPQRCDSTDIVAFYYCTERMYQSGVHLARPPEEQGCARWAGLPGSWPNIHGGLFGDGMWGQNRSMANYLHNGVGRRTYANTTTLNVPPREAAISARVAAIKSSSSTTKPNGTCQHEFQCPKACFAKTSKSQWGEDRLLLTALPPSSCHRRYRTQLVVLGDRGIGLLTIPSAC